MTGVVPSYAPAELSNKSNRDNSGISRIRVKWVDHFLFQVGARYDIEYIGRNLTLLELRDARLTRTRSGPEGDEYEFETKGRVVLIHAARMVNVERA